MAVNKVILNGSTIMDVSGDTVDAGRMLSAYTATKNNGTKVTGNIVTRTSANMTANGSTVTATAGYYSANTSKNVSAGAVTAPGTINATSATLTAGTNTITLSKTVSVTPNVTTAGYISQGTAGNAIVSLTANVTTKGAATYTPSTAVQTIASGQYLTGVQTIASMPAGDVSNPTAEKGTVTNHSILVTPSVKFSAGYITGGTKTGTAVTVSAAELVSGTLSITSNSTGVNVTNYAAVDVNVSADSYRPDGLFVLGATNLSSFRSYIANKNPPASMYDNGKYVFPSIVSIGSYIVSSLNTIQDYGFAGKYIPSNMTFPEIINLRSYAFLSATIPSDFDFSLTFPKVSSLYYTGVFCSASGVATTGYTINISRSDFKIIGSLAFAYASISEFIAPYLEYFGSSLNTSPALHPSLFMSTTKLRLVSLNAMTRLAASECFRSAGLRNYGCSFYFPELTNIEGAYVFSTAYISSFYSPKLKSITSASCAFWSVSWYGSTTLDMFSSLETIDNSYSIFAYAKSIQSVNFSNLSYIISSPAAFLGCSSLINANFPKLISINGCDSAFSACTNLQNISVPNLETISGINIFYKDTSLQLLSFPKVSYISGSSMFAYCSNLISLILLNSNVIAMGQVNWFVSTPIGGYSAVAGRYGSVFVPRSLVNTYKTATNWTTISSRIFAYEDYFS